MNRLPDEFTATYSTEAYDHDYWTVTNDTNGHLIGWICETKTNRFDACRLRYDDTNSLEIKEGLSSLEQAKCFVFNTSDMGGKS